MLRQGQCVYDFGAGSEFQENKHRRVQCSKYSYGLANFIPKEWRTMRKPCFGQIKPNTKIYTKWYGYICGLSFKNNRTRLQTKMKPQKSAWFDLMKKSRHKNTQKRITNTQPLANTSGWFYVLSTVVTIWLLYNFYAIKKFLISIFISGYLLLFWVKSINKSPLQCVYIGTVNKYPESRANICYKYYTVNCYFLDNVTWLKEPVLESSIVTTLNVSNNLVYLNSSDNNNGSYTVTFWKSLLQITNSENADAWGWSPEL